MKTANIEKVLNNLGVSTINQWMKLPALLSEVQFANDMREYNSVEDFYKFDTTNEQLLVSRGHKGEIVDPKGTYDIDAAYAFCYIDAFVCSSIMGAYGSSYTRQF